MEKARALILGAIFFALGLAACTAPETPRAFSEGRAPSSTPASPTNTPFATSAPAITPTGTAPPPTALPPTSTRYPTSTPLACLSEGGTITRFTLATPLEPRPWQYRVYTPPCYAHSPDQHYPLLILIHGSTFTDDQWDRLGADEMADQLIRSEQAPPFLILMPRDREWTDPLVDPFGQALVEYLLPWVDTHYRTIPTRAFRAIGGLSRGASWAVHLGLSQWETFGAIGGHSLPVFVKDPARLTRWLDEIPPDSRPRIFLDIGEHDYLRDKALWFENLLTEKNFAHEWYLFPGRHEEAYWQAHLEQYLLWYTAAW